jgi:hypothetical protein
MTESIQIYLNSSNSDKIYDNNISDAEYHITPISIPDGFYMYLSVKSATIPYSFYNINNFNNTFVFSIKDNPIVSIVLNNGNYNINQLVSELSLLMISFKITYNVINNKLTFKNDEYFKFYSTSTCYQVLGFIKDNDYLSINNIIKSVNCVNIMSIKRINLQSNFQTNNINKSATNNNSIICSIPVNKPPYSLIEFTNYNNFRINLFINTISFIYIKLVDEHENLVDLNGLNYSLTLQIDVEPFK